MLSVLGHTEGAEGQQIRLLCGGAASGVHDDGRTAVGDDGVGEQVTSGALGAIRGGPASEVGDDQVIGAGAQLLDPSTLVYWRRRLATSERPDRIGDAVKAVIAATGVLRGRHRRAVDSTILADAVATQDTITQLIAAVRRVARVLPGAADLVAAVCTGHDYTSAGKPRIDWDDPDAKDGLVSALVNDAIALVNAMGDKELATEHREAVALLALVAGQDVEPADGSDGTDGRWKIAHRVAEDRVISTVDPEARHTRTSPEARRDGYRAHPVAEPGTGLITDEALTKAAGPDNSDAAIAATFLYRSGYTRGPGSSQRPCPANRTGPLICTFSRSGGRI